MPVLTRRPGADRQPDGSYQLSAAWQSGLSNGLLVGQILGLFANGLVADRYGYRRTMMAALLLVVAFVFVQFFAQNLPTLLVGEILLGVPFGAFQTLACTYASEVCPTALRAYLTTYVNLCWVLGQILASGLLRGLVRRPDRWAFRIPFAVQWFWPIPIGLAVVFAPESPWWLVRQGRLAEARRAVARLASVPTADAVDKTLALISHTDRLERAASAGTSYADCFRGTDLRRTEIVGGVWAIQMLCGSPFMGFSTYFYEQAGLEVSNAFTMTLAQFCLGGVGTVFSWFLMGWCGRRTLYLAGLGSMAGLLGLIGCVALAGGGNAAAQWAIGSLLLLYTFVYDCTVGPVCYSLVTEMTSTRLKTKSVVLARNMYNITSIVTNIITPLMLNPTAWAWGAKAGFFWAGTCTLCWAWTFFRVPEPQGRTYGEMDVLFAAKVPARQFRGATVQPPQAPRHDGRGPEASTTSGASMGSQA